MKYTVLVESQHQHSQYQPGKVLPTPLLRGRMQREDLLEAWDVIFNSALINYSPRHGALISSCVLLPHPPQGRITASGSQLIYSSFILLFYTFWHEPENILLFLKLILGNYTYIWGPLTSKGKQPVEVGDPGAYALRASSVIQPCLFPRHRYE